MKFETCTFMEFIVVVKLKLSGVSGGWEGRTDLYLVSEFWILEGYLSFSWQLYLAHQSLQAWSEDWWTERSCCINNKIFRVFPKYRSYLCLPLILNHADDWEIPFEAISDLKWLGSGAQGAVFSGKLKGEVVAVKKVREQKETDIRNLRKLNHPNIVQFKWVK